MAIEPFVADWPEPIGSDGHLGLVGELIELIGPQTEADPNSLILQFLAGFGNVVGRSPYFEVEADQHHLNLFTLIVGSTSKGRKGVSLGWAMKAFELADPMWSQRRRPGLSSGEGLIFHVRDADPDNDDPGVTDKRLFVTETEFGSALKVMTREGNTVSPVMRDAWDRGSLATLTKNNPTRATGAHISVIGHVTPEELRRLMGNEIASGLGNRFLFGMAKRSKMLPEGGDVDPEALREFQEHVAAAVEFARDQGQLKRSEEARGLWIAEYPRLSDGPTGLLGTVLGRAEAQVLRLSAIFAVLDCSSIVEKRHVSAALAVWQYCEDSATYTFQEATGTGAADVILVALQASYEGLSRTEISGLFSRNRNAFEIQQALRSLEEAGLARSDRVSTGGRPSERWYAVTNQEQTADSGW